MIGVIDIIGIDFLIFVIVYFEFFIKLEYENGIEFD